MMRALLAACLLAWCALAAAAPGEENATAAPRQVLVLVPMPPPHFRADGGYGSGYVDAAGRAAGRRTAAALARSYGLRMATDWPLPAIGVDCYVMDVPEPLQPGAVAARLAREPGVSWAQVMNEFRVLGHDDPLFDQQPAAQQWHLAELHQAVMGRGVRIAVVDSGVQADHPDLAGQVLERMNLLADRADAAELHGTAVAGVIAARADNGVGISGVAPLARLLTLRACWQVAAAETRCNSLSLALALNAALDRGVDVVNLSLGGPADRLVRRLIEAAQARGTTVVAARNGAVPGGGFPAAVPGVIAVGDGPASPPPLGISAPGADVLTTLPGSRWGLVSGASYAAAHVSGLVALMIEARGRGGALRVRARPGLAFVTGPDGRIDACATLQRAAQSCVCSCGAAALADSVARP